MAWRESRCSCLTQPNQKHQHIRGAMLHGGQRQQWHQHDTRARTSARAATKASADAARTCHVNCNKKKLDIPGSYFMPYRAGLGRTLQNMQCSRHASHPGHQVMKAVAVAHVSCGVRSKLQHGHSICPDKTAVTLVTTSTRQPCHTLLCSARSGSLSCFIGRTCL